MTDQYAVMGNPIAHSKSPRIHQGFAEQTGQALVYQALLVGEPDFTPAVESFFSSGGKGLNITVPFKQQAWQQAQQLTERARLAGAVNTLYMNAEGQLCGDNTDGVGLVRDLRDNLGVSLTGKKILLLGAGGAVRGVLAPLLAEAPQRLCLANRTAVKARDLAKEFSAWAKDCWLSGCGLDELQSLENQPADTYDLIINGTAASLAGERPPIPKAVLATQGFGYDMMYGTKPTPLNQWLQTQGWQTADGLGMLVEQAAESFFIWRGVRPETKPVIQLLRG